jgi:hypothetical protein
LETSAYDAYQRLQSQRVVFDNGGQQVKQYDPNNTHPYDKLEISEGADGKPTNVQFNLDKDTETRSTNGGVVDLGVIGQVFGSSIGRILAPDNQFGHLLGGTVGGLIGQKLAQNFAASLTFDGSKGTNADFTTFSGLDVASAAAGSVASFLIAEIGTKLGLQGYGAQLFNSGAGAFTGSILNTVIQHGGLQVLAQEATWATAFATAEGAVGGTLGGILAQNLVHAESKQGAVGGQLLGAVGSALGMSFVALQAITGILGFVIPGVGSFFGTILGTMLGDAIAGDPGAPKAVHDVQILGSDTHFTNRLVGTDDHGNAEVSRKMSAEVVTIANNFLDAIHGAGISYPGKVMIGYNDGSGPYDYITGWFPNGTEATPRFTDPNDAIQEGVRELLIQTKVIGGDLLLKRAQQAFIAGSHPDPYAEPTNFKDLIGLSGDLRTAQDYEIYLNNREAINAVMAANPDTAFTAGWIATFARVNDLKLNQVGASDFLGGLVGWLDSVAKAGLGAEAANVTVRRPADNSILVEIKVANGVEVPGALSVFADHMNIISDASGQTLQFTVDGGFSASATQIRAGGESGTAGNDILVGSAGDDTTYGGAGWDFIDGGAGSDHLYGEDGNDILRGGRGNDELRGGQGNDTYVFTRGDGADIVFDDYSALVLIPPDPGAPAGTPVYENRHLDGGKDSLVFGPGIAASDIAVQLVLAANGIDQNLIVGVRDPAHPGVPFGQLTDTITLQKWNDAYDRIETFVFADGTTLNVGAALGSFQVPLGETLSRNTVAENSAIGTVVGKVSVVDFNPDAVLHYSVAAAGPFAINATTGEITVAGTLNYEEAALWQPQVSVSDQYGHAVTGAFFIHVTDLNEKPADITLSGGSAPEDSPGGTIIATAHGIDPDPGTTLHYSLTDNAGGHFLIYQTGQIAIVDRGLIDYETASSYQITVRAADQYGLFLDKQFTLHITDVYERVHADFNGDGRSDILLHGDSGTVAAWDSGMPSGGHIVADPGPASSWHLAGLGDFDGNARADILWQNDDGTVAVWDNGVPAGGHVVAGAGSVAASWHIAAVDDFDGNHRGDILWRGDDGAVAVWDNGTPAGGRMIADSGATAGWHAAATGDFDGNGKADVVWQNDNGAVAVWDNGTPGAGHIIVDPSLAAAGWHFAAVGDFDGNHHDDILWRNDSGAVAVWNDGAAAGGHVVADPGPAASWHVAGAGDFDGNGKADILGRNDSGAVAVWDNGTPAGGHSIADSIAASWHIV